MTEGVGSERVSVVSELARILAAQQKRVQLIRARRAATVEGFAGYLWNWVVHTEPEAIAGTALPECEVRLANLAVEGTSLEYDFSLVPQLPALHPDAIVIFRGVVEGVHRMTPDSLLYRSLPRRWRAVGGLDPRCYFSDHPVRRLKQRTEAGLKSRLRRAIMRLCGAQPMMRAATFERRLRDLVAAIRAVSTAPVFLCELLPVRGEHFPGAGQEFADYNGAIARVAGATGAILVNWRLALPADESIAGLYFADGLHLNEEGNARLASHLLRSLGDALSAGPAVAES